MSIAYCNEHHRYHDTDFEVECDLCESDQAEREELLEDLKKIIFSDKSIKDVKNSLIRYLNDTFTHK